MKVLIISHNPISTYHNMGKTMLSMLGDVQPWEVCQLYIYPSLPDTDVCGSYYRVTDKDILRSYYKFKMGGGEIRPQLESKASLFEDEGDEQLYRNTKNAKPHRALARDLMWKCSHWFGKSLKEWLKKEAPTEIFVLPGKSKFLYDMALKISKYLDIPIITYICDDYYFVQKPTGALARLRQKLLSRKIEQLMKKTTHIVTICDELKEHYSSRFGVPATTVMTGSNYPISSQTHISPDPQTITYMGNIRCNRYTSLAQIGRALDRINERNLSNYELHIYTGEKDTDILSSFDGIRSVCMKGFVGGEAFEKTFHSTQMLLHTESFDEKSMDEVKHSVSTKIADSLGSGIPFVAYGPDSISSMKHLIRNDCAICITSPDELENKLEECFANEALRAHAAAAGLEIAKKYHDAASVSRQMREIFESLSKG